MNQLSEQRQHQAVIAASETAKYTKHLAVATVALAIGTVVFAGLGYSAQRAAAREAERQSCFEQVRFIQEFVPDVLDEPMAKAEAVEFYASLVEDC